MRRFTRLLVLPDPKNMPAVRDQLGIVPAVALDVPLELREPVRRVCSRTDAVLRALMPEASVDEDRDPLAREDDIRATSKGWDRPTMLPEAESQAMDR
jgi:hypothetical protein